MAAVTTAVVAAAGTAYAANQAKKGTAAQVGAQQQGIGEQRRQFEQSREDFAPFREAGVEATNQIRQLLGGDLSAFKADPGYQFRLGQGQQALERSASARGGLFAGGTGRDLTEFAQGAASQEYGNYFNRLLGLSQLGSGVTGQLGQLGQATSGNIANMYGNIGQAQAQGAANRASIYGNFANQLGSLGGYYAGARGGGGVTGAGMLANPGGQPQVSYNPGTGAYRAPYLGGR